jgi:transcriptional regulator with XRE-family HTH domain
MPKRNFNKNLTKQERERIGELVKVLRNNSGISQKELAFKTGLSPARITQIEKGTLDYRIDTLIVIHDHIWPIQIKFDKHNFYSYF